MTVTYTEKLYLSDKKIDKEAVRADILNERPRRGLYVLAMSEGGRDLIDIIATKELVKPLMKERDLTVVGLAKGYRRSLRLAWHIIRDVYAYDKGLDLNGYFHH